MKILTDFRETVETGMDPRLISVAPIREVGAKRETETEGNAGGEVSVPNLICAGKSRSQYLTLHCRIYTTSSLKPS